jgi:hypothetical protein
MVTVSRRVVARYGPDSGRGGMPTFESERKMAPRVRTKVVRSCGDTW